MNQKTLIKSFWVLFFVTLLTFTSYISGSLMFLWITVLIVGLYVLVKSSDMFIDNAEKIGMILGIPSFVVGVLLVAIGTSLPELITSIIAVSKGTTEFVAGNVIGSNIANILLVLGISVFFTKKSLKVKWDLIQIDLPLLLGSASILLITLLDGVFTFYEAVICIIAYIVYVFYSLSLRKDNKGEQKEKISAKIILMLLLSGVGIYFGAEYTIRSVIKITEILNFGDTSVIALSVVAFGTSLPELMVSIKAAQKQNYEMAIGNVLGSNIFNSFVVMGIPGLMSTLTVTGSVLSLALPVMIIATFLFIISTMDRNISKYEGSTFLIVYILFIGKLFGFI